MELVRLVQRNLEAARGDLHRPGEARRRRIDDGEGIGRDLAGLGDLLHERGRRGAIGLEHEAGAVGVVPIAELVEQLFRGAERARRARPQHMVFLALVLRPRGSSPRIASRGRRSTGWLVCTVTMNGQEDERSAVSSDTRPRPPRQISPMRRPASNPPTARTPQSMRVSPSCPCDTSTRKA